MQGMTEDRSSLQTLYPSRLDGVFLLAASVGLLTAGLRLPVLTVRKIWEVNTFSIFSGIENLWEGKFYFLAAVVFFFSVIFPIGKLIALFVLWFAPLTDRQRRSVLTGLETFGRWSMLDVFVVAVLIVSVKLGVFASAKPESGIYFFGGSIFLAMIATDLQTRLVRRSRGHS